MIVESPAKVKTIKKFLGSNYDVAASNGHIVDLPKSRLGIDVDNDFEPKYITIRGKGDLLASLKKAAKKSGKIFLATDPDREGEAISWHLSNVLGVEDKKINRITFNEITKTAVRNSLKNPRKIDMDLVNEQQARRCLDRMVGYEISPLLWKKIKRGLSAGRVQSVTLRLIADREEEINAFIPEEYWTLDAIFMTESSKKELKVAYYGKDGKKAKLSRKEDVDEVLERVSGADFSVTDIKKGERTRKAPLPFTTSTLQQEASNYLNFSTSKTMRIAQQLYEGVDVKGRGTIGLISYLRTDSTRVSDEADKMARDYIEDTYGKNYLSNTAQKSNSNKNSQDAHEAIRPTDITLTPVIVKESLTRDQQRLYQLIWRRFAASRMAPAKYETINLTVEASGCTFTASASNLVFDGFKSVYINDNDNAEKNPLLSKLAKGDKLELSRFDSEQHFTQPPAHYTEASLVRTLEELGIGRPSTYAPTITLIIQRHYVAKEGKNLYMTELGEVVNNMMKQAFPSIVDVKFTANMEGLLDCVGEGTVEWKTVLRNFWPDLKSAVEKAEKELEHVKVQDEVTDVQCDKCGRFMVIKYGPHGRFLGCPGFPECRNTMPLLEKTGAVCPKCGKDIVVKHTRKGRRYYGCEGYPECDYMSWKKP